MNMPGFTAEFSVYRTSGHFQMVETINRTDGLIHPALCVDPSCFEDCYADCNQECFGLAGPAKSWCLKECQGVYKTCYAECTGPCPPPPPPIDCGTHLCPAGHPCCGPGCCPEGEHCCDNIDVVGCCPDGTTCREIFGLPFCSPV
jgi:hypothetical protein